MQKINVKLRSNDARLPTKAHPDDAGYDLYASEDVIIEPGETVIIPTGVSIELPQGYEAQIRPRSGVTVRTKIRVQLGTIDANYRGELGVIADNTSRDDDMELEEYEMFLAKGLDGSSTYDLSDMAHDVRGSFLPFGTYFIRKGDRIAQLVINRLPAVSLVASDDINETERGEKGYGSSGIT